jgi:anti-anti-sigma factor
MNNLEINRENLVDEIILRCTGRLDANQAGHLNDYIDRIVREGHYFISLDLSGIEYLSSAGIRSLVSQYKNLKAVNGHFTINAMSENVKQVLYMVGMANMLSQPSPKTKPASVKKQLSDSHIVHDYHFQLTPLNLDGNSMIGVYGKPELMKTSGFSANDARKVESSENHFAIGLGAIGDSFGECKNRFGEFIMLGKNVVYLPADGSKKPDYMVSSGQLVASLTELYGIHFEGNFSSLISFEASQAQTTLGLSQLIEGISKLTGFGQFALVMLAESGGLIGTSLNASPVEGQKLFSFPEVKDTINFTTEPAHLKMLTLSVGVISAEKNGAISKFIRPLKPGSTVSGHVHSALFPYIPLKKTDIDLTETIDYLFNNAELVDILHLTYDSREIVGLGESQFVQGFCWLVPIVSINQISN